MRMLPSLSSSPQPARIKPSIASMVKSFKAPLKGLNLDTKDKTGDPLTAPILSNMVVMDDSIDCRPGYAAFYTHPDGKPIASLMPFTGATPRLLAGTNGKLSTTAGDLWSGFLSDDWSATAFANLSQTKYLVMANGKDGVWSWDGGTTASSAPGPVTVTKLTKTNPATCTVASADITKFKNGDFVVIAGATGTGMVNANGAHMIASVGTPANTFTLLGVDCSAGAADQTTGLTAQPAMSGSLVKETITLSASGTSWFDPNAINIVLAHQNRLFMADTTNLVVYYLPLQQKSGDLKQLPLNAIFRRGGTIRALFSWSVDGGAGQNNNLVIFSDQNECAIYQGNDPDTNFSLVGVYRFDSPMSKGSVASYGGECYVMISTGLVPMTTLMRAETEQLGITDKAVLSEFQKLSTPYAKTAGWSVTMDSTSGRMICNLPMGADNRYRQMVRKMPSAIWTSFDNVPARSWAWLDRKLYFGDDKGNIWLMDALYLSDNGNPIHVDGQFAWSNFGTPAWLDFKNVRLYYLTDGSPQPYVDVKADFDQTPPQNRPEISMNVPGAAWDVADWDTSDWAAGEYIVASWNGVAAKGNYGAVRFSCDVLGCTFRVKAADVMYEPGSLFG